MRRWELVIGGLVLMMGLAFAGVRYSELPGRAVIGYVQDATGTYRMLVAQAGGGMTASETAVTYGQILGRGAVLYLQEDDGTFRPVAPTDLSTGGGGITSLGLGELKDVDTSGLSDGQGIKWDASRGKWLPDTFIQPIGLGELTDVDTTGLADGQGIKWDASRGKWLPDTFIQPIGLGELTDVDTSGLADGQGIKWDASSGKWIPDTFIQPIGLGELTDVDTTGLADKQFLQWDATKGKWLPTDITVVETQTLQFVVFDPENIPTHAGRSTQSALLYLNNSGANWTIMKVYAVSDEDDYTFALYTSFSADNVGVDSDVMVDTFVCSADGTGCYTCEDFSFASDTLTDNTFLIFEHVSGTAGVLHISVVLRRED